MICVRVRAAAALLLAFTFVFDGSAQAQNAPKRIDPELLLQIRSVSGPQISPDGAWIAYAVERNDLDADEKSTQIFMVSADGEESVQLTSDDYSASTPRWSADGRQLGFLAAKGGDDAKTQVWTLDIRGGDSQQHTNVDQGVKDFRWAPDGKKMLLMIKDKTAADLADEAAKAADEEARPLPYVIDRLQFKRDGVPYLDRSRTHLYVLDNKGAEPKQLTFDDYDDHQPAWSPDGRAIAFVSNRTEEPDRNSNDDIWVVSAEDDAEHRELRRITSNPGSDHSPAWSHDGKQITYITATEPDLIWYATNHLAVASANGGNERVLTESLDRHVMSPVFARNDESILFVLEDSAEQHLAEFDLSTGSIHRLVDGELSVREFSMDATGRSIALRIGSEKVPGEVYLLRDTEMAQLSRTNNALLDGVEFANMSNVTFPSADGTPIEGFVFTPPDYYTNRRYPTILRIHGGPVSQYDFSFNKDAQLLAANGYVVVISNPRGSSGYGQDFSAAIFAEWGVKDFDDVIAAVDYTIREGMADPERLGVGGWSYGGMLTNYVITKSDRFKGAISGASEVNYLANYGHDHYQKEWEAELGLPWENRDAWERISPFNDIDKVTTPTLVIGGKEDWNVPILNSEQLYLALRRLGVSTQLVVYPDEAHGISRPSFVRDRYERYLDWYGRYVKGE